MNLADAIRKASSRNAPDEAVVQPWQTASSRPVVLKMEEAPARVEAMVEELPEVVHEPESLPVDETADEAPEAEARSPYFPEPPVVTSGNVVRLELFLNSEQMTGLLKAILAGQHSVLTLKEAAAYLRVSPASVQELAEAGEIPGVLVNGAWRFPKSSLDEWMTLSAVTRLGSQLEDVENVA